MAVYRFKPRKKPTPPKEEDNEAFQGRGKAFCTACRHEWEAVAPVGVTQLECPACHAHKGRWKFSYYPPEDQLVRQCNCGNQLFYITPEGHQCAECGIYQRY